MSRNDQILFGALVLALIALPLSVLLDKYGASSVTAEWTQNFLTFSAVVVAVSIPTIIEQRRTRETQRVSEIIVASVLRTWMRVTSRQFADALLAYDSQLLEGRLDFSIAALEPPLEQVAAMQPKYARQVLSLMERRERRQAMITYAFSGRDATSAQMAYFEHTGHLFWSARRIYQELAIAHGLDEKTNLPEEIEAIRTGQHEAEKFNRLRQTAI